MSDKEQPFHEGMEEGGKHGQVEIQSGLGFWIRFTHKVGIFYTQGRSLKSPDFRLLSNPRKQDDQTAFLRLLYLSLHLEARLFEGLLNPFF